MALEQYPSGPEVLAVQAALGQGTWSLAQAFATGGASWTVESYERNGSADRRTDPTTRTIVGHVTDLGGPTLSGTGALALAPVEDWQLVMEVLPAGAEDPQTVATGELIASVTQPALRFRVTMVREAGRFLVADLERA